MQVIVYEGDTVLVVDEEELALITRALRAWERMFSPGLGEQATALLEKLDA
jgi:hypothetical protein